jgi:hypothetical protein
MSGNAGEARRKRRIEELGNLKAGGRNDIRGWLLGFSTQLICSVRVIRGYPVKRWARLRAPARPANGATL